MNKRGKDTCLLQTCKHLHPVLNKINRKREFKIIFTKKRFWLDEKKALFEKSDRPELNRHIMPNLKLWLMQ